MAIIDPLGYDVSATMFNALKKTIVTHLLSRRPTLFESVFLQNIVERIDTYAALNLTLLSEAELRDLQILKIRKTIRSAIAHVPF